MKISSLCWQNKKPDLSVNFQEECDKVYTYDEAIDLAGNGWYIFMLLVGLSIALLGMALDMFGVAVVVTSACDFELTRGQESILLSMPFAGSIVMAYPWGYIADTQGRLKGLTIALWGSYVLASISAFSPNWIVLAVLRFSCTSLSSGILSLSTTLLGECSSSKVKGPALLIVNTFLYSSFGVYCVCAYLILNLEFAYDLGFIMFTPWRLLALVLALPLGIAAVFSILFFESPKFLLNAGDEKNALKVLRKISEKNGVETHKYPVQKIFFNETTPVRRKDVPFLQSLMDQTFPLFKPPLLYRTVQLFFITVVVYSSNNGFIPWLHFIIENVKPGSNNNLTYDNMCGIISNYREQNQNSTCIAKISEFTMWLSVIISALFSVLNLVVAWFSWRKKAVHIAICFISFVCCVAVPLAPELMWSISMFAGFLVIGQTISIIFSYYVDIFPTSYRGMAACLGVMVARISSLSGTNIVGAYIISNCANIFYIYSVFIICALVASIFLPPDKPKNSH